MACRWLPIPNSMESTRGRAVRRRRTSRITTCSTSTPATRARLVSTTCKRAWTKCWASSTSPLKCRTRRASTLVRIVLWPAIRGTTQRVRRHRPLPGSGNLRWRPTRRALCTERPRAAVQRRAYDEPANAASRSVRAQDCVIPRPLAMATDRAFEPTVRELKPPTDR